MQAAHVAAQPAGYVRALWLSSFFVSCCSVYTVRTVLVSCMQCSILLAAQERTAAKERRSGIAVDWIREALSV